MKVWYKLKETYQWNDKCGPYLTADSNKPSAKRCSWDKWGEFKHWLAIKWDKEFLLFFSFGYNDVYLRTQIC